MTISPTHVNTQQRPTHPGTVPLALVCAIVLAFRVAAWRSPSVYIVIPPGLGIPLGGLGVLYLICAVWAWRSKPTALTRVFLVSGIGGCVHWGGTIATSNTGFEIAFLALYLAFTAMGDGAFLDFALRYPRGNRHIGIPTIVFYLLAILTFLAIPIAPFVSNRTLETGAGVVIMVAFVMSIAGGVIFLVKWLGADPAIRRSERLTPIVIALVVSSGLDLAAEQGWLPGAPEAWTLTYAIVPLTIAWALTRPTDSKPDKSQLSDD